MKFIRAMFAVFLISLLAACGGGGGSAGNTSSSGTLALFTTAPSNLLLSPGESQTFTISGGVPAYTATSNAGSVSVSVNGNSLTITGGGGGNASISVKDSKGVEVKIDVNIGSGLNLFTTAPSSVSLGIGAASSEFTIGGGSQIYAVVSSNPSVALAIVSGKKFVIKGMTGGRATIIIKDSVGATVSIDVVVGSTTALYTTASSDVSLKVGAAAVYAVAGGSAPYLIGSSNPGVADASIVGGQLTITGLSAGTAVINIHDALEATLKITVTVGASGPLFTTAPGSVSIGVGKTIGEFTIGGGSQIYSIASSNSQVATVGINGNKFVINGGVAGKTTVVIKDSLGVTLSIDVTVDAGLVFYTTAPSDISLAFKASASYIVGGGTGPYTAVSSNQAVAKAVIDGSNLTITALTSGTARIVLRDASGTTLSINVNAATDTFYSTAPADISIGIGAGFAPSYQIFGGTAPYKVISSTTGIATVSPAEVAEKGSFTVTGVAVGSAKITITDNTGKAININVNVGGITNVPLYVVAAASVNIATGVSATYIVGGGNAPYFTTSSDIKIATVSDAFKDADGRSKFTITAVAPGVANIVIFDSTNASNGLITGSQKIIQVTVSSSGSPTLDVSPAAATGSVGDTLVFTPVGGLPDYTVTINNSSIANLTVPSQTQVAAGKSFSVKLLNVGSTVITVSDKQNQSKSIALTVSNAASQLRISPNLLEVGEDNITPIDLTIYGGTPPYRAYTGDLVKSSVSIVNNIFTVTTGSQSTRCINPVDGSGVYITSGQYDINLTVIDSLGASATGIFRIRDNGKGLSVNGCN